MNQTGCFAGWFEAVQCREQVALSCCSDRQQGKAGRVRESTAKRITARYIFTGSQGVFEELIVYISDVVWFEEVGLILILQRPTQDCVWLYKLRAPTTVINNLSTERIDHVQSSERRRRTMLQRGLWTLQRKTTQQQRFTGNFLILKQIHVLIVQYDRMSTLLHILICCHIINMRW